jgi:uncharacterized protein
MTHSELLLAQVAQEPIVLLPGMANRHGLIAGATGTGKTVTLQRLAEGFSRMGVPVFVSDIKGDLSGVQAPAAPSPKIVRHLESIGAGPIEPEGNPTVFWDLLSEKGHALRTTVSEMGPLMLSRLLNLNETQTGVLHMVFKLADDEGLLLLDLKDLRAVVQYVSEHASEYRASYGNLSVASLGAIQRGLLTLESEGGDQFFGEPSLDISDLLQTDGKGRGVINILASEKLINRPRLYASFLLWLLSELFEQLPEVGDPEKPRLVFFFDEAHLLFTDAPKALTEKVEQVVRLIRSKGVGVYFVTQNPMDIPETILGQLGNRVQHALRAFTPRDQRAVKTAASTMRPNPALDTAAVITELGVGEALVSLLDERGSPQPVQRAWILPPNSRIGPISDEERKQVIAGSGLARHYDRVIDRNSAYEMLRAQVARDSQPSGPVAQPTRTTGKAERSSNTPGETKNPMGDLLFGSTGPRGGKREGIVQAAAKSMARTAGSSIARQLMRGLLGSITGKPGRR